jgi:hypothetical protein
MLTGTGAIQRNTVMSIFWVFAVAAVVTGAITLFANMKLVQIG